MNKTIIRSQPNTPKISRGSSVSITPPRANWAEEITAPPSQAKR